MIKGIEVPAGMDASSSRRIDVADTVVVEPGPRHHFPDGLGTAAWEVGFPERHYADPHVRAAVHVNEVVAGESWHARSLPFCHPCCGGSRRPHMPPIVRADILQPLISRRTDVPPVTHAVSLYDIRVASEEQIDKWAEEAEQGYDVEELKRRGRGRPGRGADRALGR